MKIQKILPFILTLLISSLTNAHASTNDCTITVDVKNTNTSENELGGSGGSCCPGFSNKKNPCSECIDIIFDSSFQFTFGNIGDTMTILPFIVHPDCSYSTGNPVTIGPATFAGDTLTGSVKQKLTSPFKCNCFYAAKYDFELSLNGTVTAASQINANDTLCLCPCTFVLPPIPERFFDDLVNGATGGIAGAEFETCCVEGNPKDCDNGCKCNCPGKKCSFPTMFNGS